MNDMTVDYTKRCVVHVYNDDSGMFPVARKIVYGMTALERAAMDVPGEGVPSDICNKHDYGRGHRPGSRAILPPTAFFFTPRLGKELI